MEPVLSYERLMVQVGASEGVRERRGFGVKTMLQRYWRT